MKSLLKSIAMIFVLSLAAGMAASAVSAQQEPAIGGYCPVAYVLAGKAIKGKPEFSADREDKTYWFVNEDAKQAFVKEPEKFAIKYDSWCATAVAYGKKVASDPKVFTVHNGAVYLFSNADAKKVFDKDKEGLASKADQNWGSLK